MFLNFLGNICLTTIFPRNSKFPSTFYRNPSTFYFSLTFLLDILNKEGNILRAIDRVAYNGNTNRAAYLALQRAYRQLFTTAGGSRANAVKVSGLKGTGNKILFCVERLLKL